jgi:membrane protease YdiL (CAAX protease family)
LWRGAYTRLFPGRLFLGYIYPTFGFAIWHLAPQSVHPIRMPGGVPAFIAGATFVGACWGWVAWRSGSIRWATLSHVLTDFLGLGATIYLLS